MPDIDIDALTPLIYAELHKTFVVRGQWRACSSKMQRLWEEAVHDALVRAASREGEEQGAATLLLHKLSTPAGERFTDFYTVAAVIYEELLTRYESGVAFFGLGVAWESRSEKGHEHWVAAIRRALARTALSHENPGGDGYCLFLLRESGDQPADGTPRLAPQRPGRHLSRHRNRSARGGSSGVESSPWS